MSFLTALDHRLFFAVHHLQNYHLDFLLAWPTHLGSLKLILPLLFIFVLFQSRKRILYRTFSALFPVLLSYLIADLLKIFFKRTRPFNVFEGMPEAVKVIFEPPPSFSFPSGHACTAFAAAIILITHFGVPRWAAFGMAVLVCLTRLYLGVHFPSDVIAGALCGSLITLFCLRFFKRTLSH